MNTTIDPGLMLLEMLDNSGLLRGDEPNPSAVEQMSRTGLLDLAEQSMSLTSASGVARQRSIFSQTASLSLAGGPSPCSALGCRIRHIRQLAQFAALYSDRVFIYNPLAHHFAHHNDLSEDTLRRDISDDLAIIGHVRPLIEAGRIVPLTPPEEFCPRCFGSRVLGSKEVRGRASALFKWLYDRYLEETSTTLYRREGAKRLRYRISGSDQLLEHAIHSDVPPGPAEEISGMPRLMRKIEQHGEFTASQTLRRRVLKIFQDYAHDAIREVNFELACAQCLDTTFLVDREIQAEILSRLSGLEPAVVEKNRIVHSHLTALVPFIDEVRMSDLIKIREGEQESFIVFRQALSKAIDDYRQSNEKDRPFDASDARQLYGDVIEPGIARVEQSISVARRRILKGSAAKAVAWTGAIGFGIYTGMLPAELIKIASILGLTKVVADLTAPMIQAGLEPEESRASDMYFLWKVKERTRR